MFWKKPFLLLGILAAAANSAPVAAPVLGDLTIAKRAFDDPSVEGATFRADTRTPAEIKAAGGFKPKGGSSGDKSLFNHCQGAKDSFKSADNDGYVSTSVAFDLASEWLENKLGGTGTIYKIATDANMIDCQLTLRKYNPIPDESELAAIGTIPFEQIMGWYENIVIAHGQVQSAKYSDNPSYNKAKFGDGKDDGGAQYELAGFPSNHQAWKESPWSAYTACKPKRSVLEERDPKTKTTTTTTTTAPKTTTPKTTTCSAADKKAGKCKTDAGTCGPVKTNAQNYDEYLKAYKAGKAPKSGAPAGTKKTTPKKAKTT